MDNPQATDAELGWLAGIIDGEGWVGMVVQKEHWYRVDKHTRQSSVGTQIRITNLDEEIIAKSVDVMRKIGLNPYLREAGKTNTGNQIYDVSVKHMKSCKTLLDTLIQHLTGSKKKRAELMLKFIELRQSNTGQPNPAYANGEKGRRGPRTIRPYTSEELSLVEKCIEIQSRKGASETARENRIKNLATLKPKSE